MGLALALGLIAGGVWASRRKPRAPRVFADAIPAAAPAQGWATEHPLRWPQIVLTHRATFHGHTPLNGASAFLVRTPDGRIFAATAKHLVQDAGGVTPDIPVRTLDARIASWVVFPRTLPSATVELGGLAVDGLESNRTDWLLLSVLRPDVLPATPLEVRRDRPKVGEALHLIGCPYAERDCRQNLYGARVTRRFGGNQFAYDLTPPVNLRGFSGAPLVDEAGRLVGVMSIGFSARTVGDKHIEGGAEDVTALLDAVERSPAM